jgi:tetratricopeptide (TPR) repeat protein
MEAFFMKGQFDEALKCFNHAIQVIHFHWGSNHPLIMTAQDSLGRLYLQEGKYEEAMKCYNKVVEMASKVLGNNHPKTASYCNQLADICKRWNEIERAIGLYERALLIYQTTLGSQSLTVSFNHFHLSQALLLKGDAQGALDHAMRAAAIREKNLGNRSPLTLASFYQVTEKKEGTITSASVGSPLVLLVFAFFFV